MRHSACLVFNPITVNNFVFLFKCTPLGRSSDSVIATTLSYLFQLVGTGAFLSVAWSTGVQLLVFFCSSLSVVLFDSQGSPGVGRNTFLSSPHLCFIIVFICDLFVSRGDVLMS